MKCRICANECPLGAKLCRDCAAARKRAFAATVTQRLLAAAGVPSVSQPQFSLRPAEPRTGRKPAAAVTARDVVRMATAAARGSGGPRRLSVQWLWFSLAIAAVIVYVLVRMLAANYGESTDAATAADTATDVVAVPAASSVFAMPPAAEPLPAPAPSATAAAAAPPAAEVGATAAAKNVVARTRARKVTAKAEVPEPAPPPPPIAQSAPAPVAAPPQAIAALPDPWQLMNEGLSRCSRKDWIDRASCEQGLRLHYCVNSWGIVPQCPIGPTDHGS